uniref:Flavin-containing monooxygenase n=1 Tax=Aegilops tauschii TaxID=37682 RepID=M8B6Z1_AEGTA
MDPRAKRVAIVGAGTSGLAACKHLLVRGFRPVEFVGGLWTRTLASTRLQSPTAAYRYSDFPWPDSAGAFPRHDQVVDYLAAYARRFGVDACVRFRSRVVAAEYVGAEPEGAADVWERWNGNGEAFGDGSGAWRLTVASGRWSPWAGCGRARSPPPRSSPTPPRTATPTSPGRTPQARTRATTRPSTTSPPTRAASVSMGASGSGAGSSPRSTSAVRQRTRPTGGSAGPAQEVHEFDFLILCIGMFSGVPNTPAVFPGPEAFRGRVLHSMELSDMAHADAAPLVKGKRVVVVGSRKSAFEIANDCAEANGAGTPCTMVCRNPQWMLHRADVWRGVSLAYLYMNRFAELMVPRPGAGARRLPRRHHAARAPRVGDISGDGGVVPEGDPDAGARHGARARLGELCRDMGCDPRRKKMKGQGLLAEWFLPYSIVDYADIQ